MNKVPRYMKEYASNIKKSAERYKKRLNHVNDDIWDESIRVSGNILKRYEEGFITEREAMQLLSKLSY